MSKPVALITGASQGIGAAIARAFAEGIAGARLALIARSGPALEKVARTCRSAGATAEIFICDVSDPDAVAQMTTAVLGRFKRIDVLINNAGKFFGAPLLEMTVADFDRIIAANLRSVFLVSRAVLPSMIKRGKGDIFNMSSVAGLAAYPGGTAYCAAKFGVTGLSKVMRSELKNSGVRVCCIYPGATVSPSWDGSGISPTRMMPARDVANAFLHAYALSRKTVVEEIILRPQGGDI